MKHIRNFLANLVFFLCKKIGGKSWFKVHRMTMFLPPDVKGVSIEKELNEVFKKFPHWREITASANFKKWLARQSADVYALANSYRSEDAIEIIELYQKRPHLVAMKKR